MSDLISRQDVIDALMNDADWADAIPTIKSLPSSQPTTKCIAQIRIDRDDLQDLVNEKVNEIVDMMSEPKTGKWIPISEKLPETGDSILVTYSDGEVGIVWGARPEAWVRYIESNNLIYPIAWMPLPTPYKGGDTE